MNLEEKITEKLKGIIDPHTGADIVSMGLIRAVKVEDGMASIIFAPTTPYCPIVPLFQEQIKKLAESVKGIREARVTINFE